MTGMSLSDGFGAASNYSINGDIEADITQKVVNLSGQRASNGPLLQVAQELLLSQRQELVSQ